MKCGKCGTTTSVDNNPTETKYLLVSIHDMTSNEVGSLKLTTIFVLHGPVTSMQERV